MARQPGFGTSADGDGWAAPPAPTSCSRFSVLPLRTPQSQGFCSSPQGPSGGQAKSLQPPPRAHFPLFPCCRGHWSKGTQLTASGARFTARVRGPGRDARRGHCTCGRLRRTGGSHQTGPAQTSTVQPLACEKKARNLIRGRSRPKFQPQRGVTSSRPTGARQPAALSPFPSSFGSPGWREHGESLTCRETSSCRLATHHPGGPAGPGLPVPSPHGRAGLAGGPSGWQGSSSLGRQDHAQPPRSRTGSA